MHCSSRGKGEAVLLIHGMPTNGRLWDGVVRRLCGHFRCFTIDLPGMGGTPFMAYGPAYFAQVAAQIEELRVRHHVEQWHVVGHDGGCAVAVHYAHLFPRRVGCMALLSPAIFADLRPFFLLELLRKPVLGEVLAPLVHTVFWQVAMRRAIPAQNNTAQRQTFKNSFAGYAGPWRLMRLVRWGRPEVILHGVPSILEELDHPTLVMHGSRDILPASFAERAAQMIAGARLIELDSGHFIPLEQSGRVARELAAFFDSRRARKIESGSRQHRTAPHAQPARAAKSGRRVALMPLPAAQ